jgi:hypothetical protein
MKEKGGSLLLAAGLTLLPVVLLFPVVAYMHFGPTGPQTVWPIAVYAPLAMWIETRAIRLLLNMFQDHRDPVLLAILPLGLISLAVYAVHGIVLIMSIPSLLKYLA